MTAVLSDDPLRLSGKARELLTELYVSLLIGHVCEQLAHAVAVGAEDGVVGRPVGRSRAAQRLGGILSGCIGILLRELAALDRILPSPRVKKVAQTDARARLLRYVLKGLQVR